MKRESSGKRSIYIPKEDDDNEFSVIGCMWH